MKCSLEKTLVLLVNTLMHKVKVSVFCHVQNVDRRRSFLWRDWQKSECSRDQTERLERKWNVRVSCDRWALVLAILECVEVISHIVPGWLTATVSSESRKMSLFLCGCVQTEQQEEDDCLFLLLLITWRAFSGRLKSIGSKSWVTRVAARSNKAFVQQ